MNPEIFVQNVKRICKAKGISPTTACREAGVGVSLLNSIVSRGSSPTIDRVEKLAAYLGCTVSELLGEERKEGRQEANAPAVPEDPVIAEIMSRVKDLTPDQQRLYLAQLRALEAEETP